MKYYEIVIFNIEDEYTVVNWTRENCPSFFGWTISEGDDINPETDMLDDKFTFTFGEERDALIFNMRWQGQTQ